MTGSGASMVVAVLAVLSVACLARPQHHVEPASTFYYPHPYFEFMPTPIFPCWFQDRAPCWVDMGARRPDMFVDGMTTPEPAHKRASGSEIINAMKSLPRDMVLNGRR